MDPLILGLIAILAFLVLVSQGVPIAFSFAIVGCIGIFAVRGATPALSALGSIPYAWSTAAVMIPVPLFILMGYFAFVSGITKDLYDASHKWFGKYHGGIAMATTAAGKVAATVRPAVMPTYAFAAPSRTAMKTPSTRAFMVNSGRSLDAGTKGANGLSSIDGPRKGWLESGHFSPCCRALSNRPGTGPSGRRGRAPCTGAGRGSRAIGVQGVEYGSTEEAR